MVGHRPSRPMTFAALFVPIQSLPDPVLKFSKPIRVSAKPD